MHQVPDNQKFKVYKFKEDNVYRKLERADIESAFKGYLKSNPDSVFGSYEVRYSYVSTLSYSFQRIHNKIVEGDQYTIFNKSNSNDSFILNRDNIENFLTTDNQGNQLSFSKDSLKEAMKDYVRDNGMPSEYLKISGVDQSGKPVFEKTDKIIEGNLVGKFAIQTNQGSTYAGKPIPNDLIKSSEDTTKELNAIRQSIKTDSIAYNDNGKEIRFSKDSLKEAMRDYVRKNGMPTHNLKIISVDGGGKPKLTANEEKLEAGQRFVIKIPNTSDTIKVSNDTYSSLEKFSENIKIQREKILLHKVRSYIEHSYPLLPLSFDSTLPQEVTKDAFKKSLLGGSDNAINKDYTVKEVGKVKIYKNKKNDDFFVVFKTKDGDIIVFDKRDIFDTKLKTQIAKKDKEIEDLIKYYFKSPNNKALESQVKKLLKQEINSEEKPILQDKFEELSKFHPTVPNLLDICKRELLIDLYFSQGTIGENKLKAFKIIKALILKDQELISYLELKQGNIEDKIQKNSIISDIIGDEGHKFLELTKKLIIDTRAALSSGPDTRAASASATAPSLTDLQHT